jgi:hypothetical protein
LHFFEYERPIGPRIASTSACWDRTPPRGKRETITLTTTGPNISNAPVAARLEAFGNTLDTPDRLSAVCSRTRVA